MNVYILMVFLVNFVGILQNITINVLDKASACAGITQFVRVMSRTVVMLYIYIVI